jgi:hypothetical protein
MEGRVTVNDDSDSSREAFPESRPATPPGDPEWLPDESADAALDLAEPPEFAEALDPPPGVSYGACLHLGRSGERCPKPAVRGCYCAKHHPDADTRWPTRQFARALVAGIALILILLPYFEDAVQFFLRMVRELRAN